MQYDKSGYGLKNVVPGGYVPDGKRLYYYLNRLRFRRDKRQFEYDVFGRFGLDYSREIRERAVSLLNSQGQFRFEGGMKMVAYKDFLSDIARSKVCIDLPGLGDFCFRLVNYLAVGSCVVAYPHRTQSQIPLVDKTHILYCKDDFSDLVELCDFYVQNSDERERIASNSRDFFEMYLHKDNLVNYYLHTCLTRLT